jgi:hypothetical protein
MADLERLRWLVWFINVCGMAPFRLEVDRESRKFDRLAFSFCHPVTWWFVVVLILQITMFALMAKTSTVSFYQLIANESTLTICTLVLQAISLSIIFVTPRMVPFYYKHLTKAFAYIKKVDDIIGQTGNWPCTSKRRILVGFIFVILIVSLIKCKLVTNINKLNSMQYISFFMAVLPSYSKAFPLAETTQYYLIGFLLLFPLSQIGGLYLLFHLVFYTIARRLDIMVSLLVRRQKPNDLAIIGSRMIKRNEWSTKYF